MLAMLSGVVDLKNSPQGTIMFAVFSVLAILIAISIGSFIYNQIANRVKEYSVKYHELLRLNKNYAFSDLPDNVEIYRSYSTLQKYKQHDFERELLCELRDKKDEYKILIDEAEMNGVSFQAYCDEIGAIEETPLSIIKSSRVPHKIFSYIEDKIFKDVGRCPKMKFMVTMYAEYTSPAGKNHYEEDRTFAYEEIKKAYEDMLKRVEKQSRESERRKLERAKMTFSLRYEVLRRDGFRCQICGASQADGAKLHVDHIIPVSKGGKTELNNLRTLCDMCNLGKSDKIE